MSQRMGDCDKIDSAVHTNSVDICLTTAGISSCDINSYQHEKHTIYIYIYNISIKP